MVISMSSSNHATCELNPLFISLFTLNLFTPLAVLYPRVLFLEKLVIDPKEARTFVPAKHVGCNTRALLENANTGIKNMSMLRSEFEIGGYADLHTHPFEQAYYILKGKALVTIGKDQYKVKAGDSMIFPANVEHGIKNIGKAPMWLIAVNSPHP